MNYNQLEKIKQLTDQTLIIGTDVSKNFMFLEHRILEVLNLENQSSSTMILSVFLNLKNGSSN